MATNLMDTINSCKIELGVDKSLFDQTHDSDAINFDVLQEVCDISRDNSIDIISSSYNTDDLTTQEHFKIADVEHDGSIDNKQHFERNFTALSENDFVYEASEADDYIIDRALHDSSTISSPKMHPLPTASPEKTITHCLPPFVDSTVSQTIKIGDNASQYDHRITASFSEQNGRYRHNQEYCHTEPTNNNNMNQTHTEECTAIEKLYAPCATHHDSQQPSSSITNINEHAIIDMKNMNSRASYVADMKVTYSMVNGLPTFESEIDRKRKRTAIVQVASSEGLIQVDTQHSNSLKLMNSITMNGSQKITIGCRCSRTKCLKLYCDCFRQGKTCEATCSCKDCKNTFEESGPTGIRTKVIQEILKRRPDAFQKRIKKPDSPCACKNSRCLKKYCQCFAQNRFCMDKCKCKDCHNRAGKFPMVNETVIAANNRGADQENTTTGGIPQTSTGLESLKKTKTTEYSPYQWLAPSNGPTQYSSQSPIMSQTIKNESPYELSATWANTAV